MRFLIPLLLIAIGSTRANQLGWYPQILSAQQPRLSSNLFSGSNSFDPSVGLISPSFLAEPSAVLFNQQIQGQQMPIQPTQNQRMQVQQQQQFPTGFSNMQQIQQSQPKQQQMPAQVARDSTVASTGCSTNPCQNGGTCLTPSGSGFTCTCPWGFTGARCEVGLTECASSPCPPSRVCKARFGGGFDCLCPPNRVGVNCEIQNDLCERNPCLNGGVCSAAIGGSFTCDCPKPWSGINCETNFQNPCTEDVLRLTEVKQFKNPWDRHGFLVCVDVNSFREMKCSVGTYFNEELNHCVPEGYEPPKCPDGYCLNDGVCLVDEKNMLRCSCKKGFSGERCAVNIDECALEGNAACSGGRCIDQVNGYYCQCPSGMIGLNCQQAIRNPCTRDNLQLGLNFFEIPSLAQNAYIQCTGQMQLEVRKCPDNLHWHQEEQTCTVERAPLKVGICLAFPCKNGGECLENANSASGFSCACKTGYTGAMCEHMIDYCLSSPCQNDGKCLSYAGGYTCICKNKVIDECCCNGFTNPCPPKSKMVPGVNNYFEHAFKQRYIHCDFDGRAFVRTCSPGTVWNQHVLTCTPEKTLNTSYASSGYGSGYGNGYQQPAPTSSYGGYQAQATATAPIPVQQPIAQAPSNSYGGYQTPAPVPAPVSIPVQQPIAQAPTSSYGGYQAPAPVPVPAPVQQPIAQAPSNSYGGYQTPVQAPTPAPISTPVQQPYQQPAPAPVAVPVQNTQSYGGYQQSIQPVQSTSYTQSSPSVDAPITQSSYEYSSNNYQQQQQQQPDIQSVNQISSFPSSSSSISSSSDNFMRQQAIQQPSNTFSTFQSSANTMPSQSNSFPSFQSSANTMPPQQQSSSFGQQQNFNLNSFVQPPTGFFNSAQRTTTENTANLMRRKILKNN